MLKPTKYVQPIHFEDLNGLQFERLVFAYHARTDRWKSLEWYGQSGSDLGRDIWGVRDNETNDGESVCIQCVNRTTLTFAKAAKDISKILKASNGVPHLFRIVARSNISADMRDRIKEHVKSLGVRECDVWSGSEFEEFLRHRSLLKRFVEGEEFPDSPSDLLVFAQTSGPLNDSETLALMAKLFDRPAFYTPIREESNLADFKQAITLASNNLRKRQLHPACARAELAPITWHALRHTHGTLLHEQGTPLRVAQAQLGHSHMTTTLEVYTHASASGQRQAVNQLENQLFPNVPEFAQFGQRPN